MPRSYGRFTTSIWRDRDFTGLTPSQQAAYFMLSTQPEVSAAGVLPLTLRRWAQHADGWTALNLRAELEQLVVAGHILIDDDTEELLICKFIKWDQGWYNEKRWPLVRDAITSVSSVHIRDTAVDELRRLALSDGVSDTASRRALDWLSDRGSRFDRVVVTEGDHVPEPQSATLKGEPSPEADDPSSPFCPPHQPNGPDGQPCTRCADRDKARRHAKERAVQEAAETEAHRRARFAAIAACTRCNENGFIEGPGGELLGSCSHSDLRLVGGAVAG